MSNRVLTRILQEPQWVQLIQRLDADTLSRLIDHVGLEDSGEIVAIATTDQIRKIFDEDLWRNDQPGQAESFDAERFGTWLTILLETGSAFTSEKLSEMDEDFLAMAFANQMYVINLDSLAMSISSRRSGSSCEDDLLEKALESSLSHEFEGYLALARNTYTWDAVLTSLIALDENHHDLLSRLLERICHASTEVIEDQGGLYAVLSSEEQLNDDAAGARKERRGAAGFVDPQDAAAFLKLSRGPVEQEDWITPSYFKDFKPSAQHENVPSRTEEVSTAATRLVETLKEAEIIPQEHASTLLTGPGEGLDPYPEVRQALARLAARDPSSLSLRLAELNYLSNTVVAGSSLEGRRYRPSEAADAVLAMCNLGCAGTEPNLGRQSMIELFRGGMHRAHQELSAPLRARFKDVLDKLDGLIEVMEPAEIEVLRGLLEEIPRLAGKPISNSDQLEFALQAASNFARIYHSRAP